MVIIVKTRRQKRKEVVYIARAQSKYIYIYIIGGIVHKQTSKKNELIHSKRKKYN